jgi:hypothetical protein
MKIKRWIPCLILSVCLVRPVGIAAPQSNQVPSGKPSRLLLLSPAGDKRITGGTLQFFWKLQDREPSFRIKHFELRIWDRKKRFQNTQIVTPRDTSGYGFYQVFDVRGIFKHHGKYYWKVLAVDSTGNQTVSFTYAFIVPAPKLKARILQADYPFSLHTQYNHWSNIAEYRSFIGPLYPKSQMQSYTDLGFGFHQSWGETANFELQERLLLLTQIGLGAEIVPKIRILQNAFITLTPWSRGRQCWYSTGLDQYASTMTEAAFGCDCAVMPGGNVVLSGAWVPMHRIRYGLREGGLRTLKGRGFEAGIRLTMPKSILANVKFFGSDIDFQRVPLTIVFGRIKDEYTGIHLDYRKFTLEYLF